MRACATVKIGPLVSSPQIAPVIFRLCKPCKVKLTDAFMSDKDVRRAREIRRQHVKGASGIEL
jgi:hypothetical protein